MAKESIATAPKSRPRRSPVGHRDRLTVHDQDPNYVYRWVNGTEGTGDRVGLFESMGYEKVPRGTHRIGNQRVNVASGLGSDETLPGGQGTTMVLMRQKKEFYVADQLEKAAENKSRLSAIHKVPDGFYGKVSTGNTPEE